MNRFVEECRREWGRLGVPEGVANEMAADLTADLEEAAAEGASPEDVLGTAVFDARAFAASWAEERGVTGMERSRVPLLRQPLVPMLATGLLAVLTIVAGLAILTRRSSGFGAVAVAHRLPFPGSRAFQVVPGQARFFGHLSVPGSDFYPVAWVLLLAGIAGLVMAGLVMAGLYWSPWTRYRRLASRS
jgi:hypothetical protein